MCIHSMCIDTRVAKVKGLSTWSGPSSSLPASTSRCTVLPSTRECDRTPHHACSTVHSRAISEERLVTIAHHWLYAPPPTRQLPLPVVFTQIKREGQHERDGHTFASVTAEGLCSNQMCTSHISKVHSAQQAPQLKFAKSCVFFTFEDNDGERVAPKTTTYHAKHSDWIAHTRASLPLALGPLWGRSGRVERLECPRGLVSISKQVHFKACVSQRRCASSCCCSWGSVALLCPSCIAHCCFDEG